MEKKLEALTLDKESFKQFIDESNMEIRKLKKFIEQVRTAEKIVKNNFSFIKTDEDKKTVMNIVKVFPELKTPRHIETVFYIIQGLKGKDIAERMCISEKCLKFHKTIIYNKLDVIGAMELMARYFKHEQN